MEGQLELYAPDATEDSIRAAHATAVAAGRPALIQLPSATITLTQSLPVASGIGYRGVAPTLDYVSSTVPDNGWSFTGGTVLVGDGTFAAFKANDTDLGSPLAEVSDSAITNWFCEDIGFNNFTRAISIGGVNNMGLMFSRVRNLWIRNCSDWGIFLANFMHTEVRRIWTHLCQNGHYYAALMPAATLMPGNSQFDTLFNIVPSDGRDNRLCRGIVFEAGGTNAKLNEMRVSRLQNNAFSRSQLSVSATFANGSQDIAVPDGTKFQARMPIIFTTTNYGVTLGQCYVVKSVSGNNIQIADSYNGTTITASGSGSLTLTSYGMPCIELSSRNSGAGVGNSIFNGVDVEGVTSVGVYAEGGTGVIVDISETPSSKNQDIVGRSTQHSMFQSRTAAITDFDSNSSSSEFSGLRGTSFQRRLRGLHRSNTRSTNGLNINGGLTTDAPDIETRLNNMLYPNTPFGSRIEARNTTQSLTAAQGGVRPFNGAASQTMTLPTIVDDATPANSNLGVRVEWPNTGANSLTVATDGTQLFNQIALKTSLSVAAGHMLTCIASKASDGTLFWTAWDTTLST